MKGWTFGFAILDACEDMVNDVLASALNNVYELIHKDLEDQWFWHPDEWKANWNRQ